MRVKMKLVCVIAIAECEIRQCKKATYRLHFSIFVESILSPATNKQHRVIVQEYKKWVNFAGKTQN